jgi:hypothetical protein
MKKSIDNRLDLLEVRVPTCLNDLRKHTVKTKTIIYCHQNILIVFTAIGKLVY